jgi:hypothetical protein
LRSTRIRHAAQIAIRANCAGASPQAKLQKPFICRLEMLFGSLTDVVASAAGYSRSCSALVCRSPATIICERDHAPLPRQMRVRTKIRGVPQSPLGKISIAAL